MLLKKIEISGFKSFANKTVLDFLPATSDSERKMGITAIVGPNGSGKSNVADAIRWAMGEQSMKNLRGKKSEDIIFAGSGKKSRLSYASATLYFDNSDKKIPIDFSEVIITRKIYRSGESEYLINNSRARLIDVIDILAKAGVGKESYSVVNQGMTDAVLNATPVERRTILEDAAGVKQYQIKKIRALKKLESTRGNLERVTVLVTEIEPHLKLLKRQAEKAQKGKEVSDKLKEKQVNLFAFLWNNFQTEMKDSLEEKKSTESKVNKLQKEVEELTSSLKKESDIVQNSDKREKLEENRSKIFNKLNELEKDLAISEGRLEVLREKKKAISIVKSIPVDLNYVKTGLVQIKESQQRLLKRIAEIKTLEEIQDVKELAQSIQQNIHELHQDVGKGEVKIGKTPEQIKNEKEIEEQIKESEKKIENISMEIKKSREEVEGVTKNIAVEVENDNRARQKFFELEKELSEKRYELNKVKDIFNEAKIKLARIEVREEDLVNEVRNELKMDVKELKFDGKNIDRSSLERDISKLKFQLEQIGGIDPMVVDEYNEVNERYKFLTQESKDLDEAIRSLKKVSREMDREIDKVFAKAFDQINKEFSKYFKIIFGGGKAHLVKLKVKSRKSKTTENSEGENFEEEKEDESEDERDEIGIDIFASPPGKKISNLSMLSGGERSLTSIALLFAIISYNPPPFSVLDEVEAALDEANSRRFGKILQELSNQTQFIAISHNRETMRQASLLYGVTMGEDGISKILSVKLDQVGKEGVLEAKNKN